MKRFTRPDIQLCIICLLALTGGYYLEYLSQDSYLYNSNPATGVCIFILAEAFVYTLTTRFRQWKSLQYLHIASIIAGLWILAGLAHYSNFDSRMPEISVYPAAAEYIRLVDILARLLVIVTLSGQGIFVINVAAGFIRGRNPNAA